MIKINQIECKESYVRMQMVGLLLEWRGVAEFVVPQELDFMAKSDNGIIYSGPLLGYTEDPIDISGFAYVTNWTFNKDNLITGINFVGSEAPFAKGIPLPIPKKSKKRLDV